VSGRARRVDPHPQKSILHTLSIKNISVNQENTFDFDSTLFVQSARQRYVTSLFNRQDKTYENSLSISNNG